jgi:hypothetical protein
MYRCVAAIIVVIMLAPIIFFNNPVTAGFYPPCPFYALTGYYCPGCGSTRAIHQLLHGHFLSALDLNPLMVLSLPFVLYSLTSYCSQLLINKSLPTFFIPSKWIWILFWIIIAYWILRNIPVYPFNLLAP